MDRIREEIWKVQSENKVRVVAIDGPAASGKSTVAQLAAQRLGFLHVNTGNMFRAITLAGLRRGLAGREGCTEEFFGGILAGLDFRCEQDGSGKFDLWLDGMLPGGELRSPHVASLVSAVASLKCVRDYLKDFQRSLCVRHALVMEGRDIGTVVFPDARWKFFITATPEERARRRLAQSGENFDGATLESVARDIAERDRIDSTRAIAPLRPAEDAVRIDTTAMTIDQVVDRIVSVVAE